MKRIIVTCFFCAFFISFVFSQNAEECIDCSHYYKKVECNLIMPNDFYNVRSKGYLEKLFFGDFNALTEFCYDPSSVINPCIPSGFRIIRDSSDTSFILEVKHISNYREASEEAEKEAKKAQAHRLLDIPVKLLDSLPRDVFNRIWDYNQNISNNKVYLQMYFEELPKHFKVEIKSIPISDQFAEKLYKKMVSFINNYKAKGIPAVMSDGHSVTFRTVVDDEVWSLGIHMPAGNAKIMDNLCMQIITDANANQLEESKYLSVLNNFGK